MHCEFTRVMKGNIMTQSNAMIFLHEFQMRYSNDVVLKDKITSTVIKRTNIFIQIAKTVIQVSNTDTHISRMLSWRQT